MAILHHYTVVSLRYDVHGTLFEVREAAVGDLQVRVYCDRSGGVISFITDEVAIDEVY